MYMTVILSTTLLLDDGIFQMREISLEEAIDWVKYNNPINFVGHSTVKVLGIEPTDSRDVCTGYREALVLKPRGRLDFSREYTIEEILEVGIKAKLITKIG